MRGQPEIRQEGVHSMGDVSEYAADEPSLLLQHEFMFFRQYKIFTPFRASSDMHFRTEYAVSRPRIRIILWFMVGSAAVWYEYSVENSVSVWLLSLVPN